MSARLTKAQLVAELERSHVAYQKLEAECASLRAAVKPVPAPVQRAHSAYTAALNAAREMAMKTGRVVRVGDR